MRTNPTPDREVDILARNIRRRDPSISRVRAQLRAAAVITAAKRATVQRKGR